MYFKPPSGSGTDTFKCVWLLKRSLYGLYQKIVADVIDFLSSMFVCYEKFGCSICAFLGVNIDKVQKGYHVNFRDSISKIENENGVKPPLKMIDSPLPKSGLFKSKTRLLKPSEHSVFKSIVDIIH
ncbi:unnamed protein product [Ambrosiozyma monospora]|uniref:Unnamed protein product n=1 Tax=Ambrosiozyma monospora TaxID=43982 RepID=A0A9W7DF54_AMBMO|nr:unnamed protein product [Ambrosiozyma monospora]